ncbi:MAG: TonB-dependent receptor [Burkholderiales bacterium]|nr:TonB-dependent receptor [Burkholderiales bacterium]
MNPIRTPRGNRTSTAAAAALLCSLASLAHGQSEVPAARPAAPSNASAASDDNAQRLDKIIVTAQKREQATIDVPASVATIGAEQLQDSGAVRLEDYAARLPGVSITALSRGFTSVVLRGISTGISQATPATAFYIDDEPIGSVTAYATGSTLTPDLDPYDLRRVEVLKGPQGTLYGAGAVGGLVRYVTVAPDSTKLGGLVSIGGNQVAHGGTGYEARAALNVPLVKDSMALRVSLFDREDPGYINDPTRNLTQVNKAKTHGGRIGFGWTINPDWSVLASFMTQRFRSDGLGVEDLNGPSLTPATGELQHGSSVAEIQTTGLDVTNATIKGHVGNFDLVSATTYQEINSNVTVDQTRTIGASFGAVLAPLGLSHIGAQTHQLVNTKRWSQELRAHSSAFGDKLNYDAGLFYTNEDSTNRLVPEGLFLVPSLAPLPALPGPLAAFDGPLFNAKLGDKYQEYSVFGNATYSLTPQLDVTAGLRLSSDKQHYNQDYEASIAVPAPVVFAQDVTHHKTTWLLNALYKLGAETAVYGRVATGYRPGGPSALPATLGNPSFNPDTLTSYELGFKSALAGGMASIEAAIFDTDWKDIQVQTQTVDSHGTTYQHFVNAGTARSQGAEATLLLFPSAGLTLRATAALTDSKLTADAPVVGGVSGDRMPFVPKWSGSLGADYKFSAGGLPAWIGGAVAYVGQRRSNFSQKPNATDVPSYTTLGLNAGVDIGKARVSLYGKNITDERGINFMNTIGLKSAANPISNPYAAGVIQPRTFGIDLSYRF